MHRLHYSGRAWPWSIACWSAQRGPAPGDSAKDRSVPPGISRRWRICGGDLRLPEAQMVYRGRRMPARAALSEAGLGAGFPLSARTPPP